MASLTHVCMWSNKGWKRITASEAARMHPGGTVSAHSGLFMCELCGQYVLLTDGVVQVRHFRHSSAEKSKNCPERTFGPGVVVSYNAGEHELPIRICNIKNNSFDFELGFIQVPFRLHTNQLKIEIKNSQIRGRSLIYTKERFSPKGITYLSIGGVPSEQYYLNITGTTEEIYKFWPKSVQGIDPSGTVFDAVSGKKLVYDADVIVGKKYYLLRRGIVLNYRRSHVTIKEILRKSISWEIWSLFEVSANDYNAEAAKFFLDYHCRLTETPVSIQTVWPVYVENPYIIKHNKKSVVMHLTGNATTAKSFPDTLMKRFICDQGIVIEINCNSRQQLISAGRTKALQYTYFWKEPLNMSTVKPKAVITDLHDSPIEGKQYDKVPDKGILRFTVQYDGTLNVRKKGKLINRRKLLANTPLEIDGIVMDMELEVRIGLDSVWKASFIQKIKIKENANDEEIIILSRLQSYRGSMIAAPHTLRNLYEKLNAYPKIQKWLYQCIRSGSMNEQAYRYLKSLVITQNTRGMAREEISND